MFPRLLSQLLLALLLTALVPARAQAYLALIRQGAESAEVPNALDHYGDRIATGDFNGDGYEDIAVAAPDENNDIGVGGKHGVVIVNYGSELGITHVGADVLSVGAPTDFNVYFGKGLAAGDFNGDGVDDLAVGVPGLDELGAADVGSVWIYSGTMGSGIQLAPYAQYSQDDCGSADEAGDQFGYTLAAGDMNLDGFADLFVGSIGEDNDAGLVGFFPGSAAGVSTTGSGFAKQSHLGGVNDAGALFGYSLAVGNFLGDDYLELAIGAPYGDEGSLLDMGKVYIVNGTANGPIVANPEILTPLSLGVPVQLGNAFGWSLAAGTFLDDEGKRPDLAIGEPLFDLTGAVASGRVVVVDYDGPGDVVHTNPKVLDLTTLGLSAQGGAAFGWALAAGNISTNDGLAGPDGMDDLAIGAPNYDVLVPESAEAIYWDNAGAAFLVPGSHSNFALAHVKVLDAEERNDLWFSFDEKMGWSLAFGKFDASNWDNLAIGVPQKNYPAFIDDDSNIVEAGQVYVMAPWRQPADHPHRSSVLLDCANRIYYAQRMGQRLTPASTTKALTALIAVEAIQNGDVDPDQMYTIPDWVANKVTGSQYGLFPGERISFIDLVRTMIAVSGNDCSYAIGNILTGEDNDWDDLMTTEWNLEHVIEDFAVIMEQRADQLGMSPAHTFNNPAGRPVGDHWTTAMDMAIFVDGAMDNPMFREIVGTIEWEDVFRQIPMNLLFPNQGFPPALMGVFDDVTNGYYSSIVDRDPRARGVKGGSNGPSMATGLYAAEVLNGYAKCTIFGVPPYGELSDFGAELMSMVSTDCEPETVTPAFDTPTTYANGQSLDIPIDDAQIFAVSAELDPTDTDDVCLEILRRDVTTPTTCANGGVWKTTNFLLAGAETRTYQLNKQLKQIGIGIHNLSGDSSARLHVAMLGIGFDTSIVLGPGESWQLPVPAVLPNLVLEFSLENDGTETVELSLDEYYAFELTLGEDRTTPPNFKAILRRDGISYEETLQVFLLGCNPADGNTVDVTMHNVNLPTGAPEDGPLSPSGSVLGAVSNYPNPFNPSTTIQFELAAEASVSARVYDLAGRLVRVLETSRSLPAGSHSLSWNGQDDGGRSVASGVYLVRVDDGASAKAHRMTLVK